MVAGPAFSDGDIARMGGRIGLLHTDSGPSRDSSRLMLWPFPGLQNFDPIKVNELDSPDEYVPSLTLLNCIVLLAASASAMGVKLTAGPLLEGPQGRTQLLQLDRNALTAFVEMVHRGRLPKAWAELVHARLFGKAYSTQPDFSPVSYTEVGAINGGEPDFWHELHNLAIQYITAASAADIPLQLREEPESDMNGVPLVQYSHFLACNEETVRLLYRMRLDLRWFNSLASALFETNHV